MKLVQDKWEHLRKFAEKSKGRLKVVYADLLDEETWNSAVAGVEAVIHTACLIPAEDMPPPHPNQVVFTNLLGLKSILEAAARHKVQRFIWTGSTECVERSLYKHYYTESDVGKISKKKTTGVGYHHPRSNLKMEEYL